MIGLFWIYKSQIYLKSIKVDNVKEINDFIDSDFSHYKVWDEISLQNKVFYLYEYEDIPRGRVIYDVKNTQYIIYSNNNIINTDKCKRLILKAFMLEESRVIFKYDAHYEIVGVRCETAN